MRSLKLSEFGVDAKVAGFGAGATWHPDEAEERAAWRLLLEIGTRTTVTPLARDQGSIDASLRSLYALFDITRATLAEAGPVVAKDRPNGDPSLASLAVWILNGNIRPVLDRWHADFDNHMGKPHPGSGPLDWEREWPHCEQFREELAGLRQTLRNYLNLLGAAAGAEGFARAIDPAP